MHERDQLIFFARRLKLLLPWSPLRRIHGAASQIRCSYFPSSVATLLMHRNAEQVFILKPSVIKTPSSGSSSLAPTPSTARHGSPRASVVPLLPPAPLPSFSRGPTHTPYILSSSTPEVPATSVESSSIDRFGRPAPVSSLDHASPSPSVPEARTPLHPPSTALSPPP